MCKGMFKIKIYRKSKYLKFGCTFKCFNLISHLNIYTCIFDSQKKKNQFF